MTVPPERNESIIRPGRLATLLLKTFKLWIERRDLRDLRENRRFANHHYYKKARKTADERWSVHGLGGLRQCRLHAERKIMMCGIC